MKKRLAVIIVGMLGFIAILGYSIYAISIQKGQDTVIQIYQKDENGTPIVSPSPIKLVGKAGHRNLFKATLSGYELTTANPLPTRLPRQNQVVHLTYKSTLSQTQIQHRLATAKYLSVGTQSVNQPVLNGQQLVNVKNKNTVARISTSDDGKTWTKLPISYPKTKMTKPVILYVQQRLYLFDGAKTYMTTNFVDWHQSTTTFSNSVFKDGQVIATMPAKNGASTLVVTGKNRRSGKRQYYAGRVKSARLTVANWQSLHLKSTIEPVTFTMNQRNQRIYTVQTTKRYFNIYQAKKLTGPFKLVKRVKRPTKVTVNSVALLPKRKTGYRLVYNVINRQGVQSGPAYRELTAKFKPTGRQRDLITDFSWYRFEVVNHEY
ncbi:polysaccharide biosynthesis protein [Lactobacillus sp. CBA3605]|uniref:polysaccharide biosynthesis protein n=1 Tax=Lactobacillus sp. CBA3605 TaxID=2099788 RepID=UPI000CFC9673|nr:polysaccharide biosynthesis protein [Lactobacillus sp. CBA3605]AVK62249.1 polysaccharide biosynthesis protein [Lactobacillus sp. CBA3605]